MLSNIKGFDRIWGYQTFDVSFVDECCAANNIAFLATMMRFRQEGRDAFGPRVLPVRFTLTNVSARVGHGDFAFMVFAALMYFYAAFKVLNV